MKKYQLKKNNFGFTLVELMVAIAIFSIVMVTAVSALMNVIDANNKARAIKTAINNISLALEGISKDMRMGTEYACGNNSEPNDNCPDGGNIIKYRSIRADYDSALKQYGFAYYKFENGAIKECLEKNGNFCNFTGPFTALTSSEVNISKAVFYVLGVQFPIPDSNKTQPRMIVTISGEAGAKEKIKTIFDLQTSISERTRPKTL